MCYLDADPCDVWSESTPCARKEHRCSECRLPIRVGTVYRRVQCLYEGRWDTYRTHPLCREISEEIQLDVCCQSSYMLGGDLALRDLVLEHLSERPSLKWRWRKVLRAAA